MKVYESVPKTEVIIVRQEKGGSDYEFYIMRPILVGGARKVGTQRVLTDDGQQFTNLSSASRYMLEMRGESELAQQQPHRIKQKFKFSGLTLVEKGAWVNFCKIRKINVKELDMDAEYILNLDEAESLGLIGA